MQIQYSDRIDVCNLYNINFQAPFLGFKPFEFKSDHDHILYETGQDMKLNV